MITYTGGQTILSELSGVPTTDTTNMAALTRYWNQSRQTVAGMRGGNWPWLIVERTVDTTASQAYVIVPNDIRKIAAVRVVVPGSASTDPIYLPRLIQDPHQWQAILAGRYGTSDVPYFAYQQDRRLYFSPTPATTGNDVIITGRLKVIDLSIADYTTGGVLTATNGSTAVVGTGTTWAASMAGRYIRITKSDTANKGDGAWYKIASVTDTTNLVLEAPYQGTSIAAGNAAYTIGQVTYEPEPYHMAPIYRALAIYWQGKEDMTLSNSYWAQYDGGFEKGDRDTPGGLIAQMIDEADQTFDGNYMPPTPRKGEISPYPPYYNPWLDASGF